MTLPELRAALLGENQPAYRAEQVYRWLHRRDARRFSEMTDLGKDLRERLDRAYEIAWAEPEWKRVSKDGTVKYLFRLNDGEYVESVVMRYRHGDSICVSTQVGCKMGCAFCATGKQGFTRDLSASEMLAQIQSAAQDAGERPSHVVLMGMGEPLDNYQNVLRFLELVSSPQGMDLGTRRISLSTCGVVDKIYDLADRRPQLTLSVSLHAPNDRIRGRIMPVNRRWGVEELLRACRYYSDTTRRRISFEYAMIRDLNDGDGCARELAERLKGILAHVNLIPVNDVAGAGYQKSGVERLKRFSAILGASGVPVTVRRTLGSDIEASCGQLKGQHRGGTHHES